MSLTSLSAPGLGPRLFFALCLAVTACTENSGPAAGSGLEVTVLGASDFQATPLDTVAEPLSVRVTDASAKPIVGLPVLWSTPDGGMLIPIDSVTGAGGIAHARWVLGWHPGAQHAVANVENGVDPAVFTAVAAGFVANGLSTGEGRHRCATDAADLLYCWGDNFHGELGDGTTTSSATPVPVQLPFPVRQVTTAGWSTCAVTTAGDVYCWGDNGLGQLGNGTTTASLTPAHVSLPAGPYKALASSFNGNCALSIDGSAYCWGWNPEGSFGIGPSGAVVATPTLVLGGHSWKDIAISNQAGCGIRIDGQPFCWGRYPEELGVGADTSTNVPLPVFQAPAMDSITLSIYHACGLTATLYTYCWGVNSNIGKVDPRQLIVPPLALDVPPAFVSVRSTAKPTFALDVDGMGYWWGPPSNATAGGPYVPTAFTGDILVDAIGTSDEQNGPLICGIEQTSGTVFCWEDFFGDNQPAVRGIPSPR